MDKIMAGHKLRRFRQSLDMSQSNMAETLGISPSYLNLLEHNQRPLTAALLLKIGSSFNINIMDFAEDDTSSLIDGMADIFTDPVLADERVTRRELQDSVSASPNVTRAIIKLFEAYRRVRDELVHKAGDSGISPMGGSSVEKVRQLLEDHHNYFPDLENHAQELREEIQVNIPGIGAKS